MKPRSLFFALPFLASLAWAHPSSAAVLFSDGFNSTPQGLNQTAFNKWNVTAGSVDVIGTGFFDFYPGNGNYVDLDGTSTSLGTLTTKQSFAAGTYDVSFNLSAYTYQGQYPLEKTLVSIGSWSQLITPSVDSSFTPGAPMQSFSFKVTTNGGPLVFQAINPINPGQGTNVGNILDNVQVAAVPEPATWIMMLLGFALVGLIAYRCLPSGRAATASI
ncbi:MAG TPA: PEPxxWA-CTERM sorting domain-containing protein [Xanthobacteraceae bacterium]|nr:PEPxxWA-CTERM sorting domain-containing protein [Xanthobacteraceae bacterium]